MQEKTKVVNNGIGFIGVLQITFIILKLCGVINWSWWVVMLPILISNGAVFALLILCFILVLIGIKYDDDDYNNYY